MPPKGRGPAACGATALVRSIAAELADAQRHLRRNARRTIEDLVEHLPADAEIRGGILDGHLERGQNVLA
jgi:hypothetical protein